MAEPGNQTMTPLDKQLEAAKDRVIRSARVVSDDFNTLGDPSSYVKILKIHGVLLKDLIALDELERRRAERC